MQHPELYRQNGICHEEQLENLLILLEASSPTNKASTCTIANLPSNKGVLTILSQPHSLSARATVDNEGATATGVSLDINQLCTVIGQKEINQGYDWYTVSLMQNPWMKVTPL